MMMPRIRKLPSENGRHSRNPQRIFINEFRIRISIPAIKALEYRLESRERRVRGNKTMSMSIRVIHSRMDVIVNCCEETGGDLIILTAPHWERNAIAISRMHCNKKTFSFCFTQFTVSLSLDFLDVGSWNVFPLFTDLNHEQ